KDVIDVWRDEERSKEYRNVLESGDVAAFKEFVKSAKTDNPDREEALRELMLMSLSGWTLSDAIAIHQQYLKEHPDGNFLAMAHQQLASLQAQAKKTYGEMEKLLGKHKAYACFKAGEIHLNGGKFEDAQRKFAEAQKEAETVRDENLLVAALGFGGEALLRLKKNDEAKKNFETLFEKNTFKGIMTTDGNVARGIAHKGLGDLDGDTEAAYTHYQKASYWLGGNIREGQCVLRMMQIAEALSTKGEKWADRADKLRKIMQARWPELLKT
ncbi:MAG: hypothetical protein L6Q71_11635, partial [Planctomycetes bacterium]|nr:hypothetical protein [Planctomycetota bacterium]